VADLTRIIGIRIVAFHQPDGMTEEAELHEPEVKREDRRGDDQPHARSTERVPGSGAKMKLTNGPVTLAKMSLTFWSMVNWRWSPCLSLQPPTA
jgi:hypothetical protein